MSRSKRNTRRPPGHLSKASKRWFLKVSTEFVFETEAEWTLLAEAAATLDRLEQARQVIAEKGLTVATGTGSTKPNPAVNVERDCQVTLCRLLRELRIFEPAEDTRPPRLNRSR